MESTQRPTAILAIDTPGHFAVQLEMAKEFALQGFSVIALVNAPAEIHFLRYLSSQQVESGRPRPYNLVSKLYYQIKSRLRGSRLLSLRTSWLLFELSPDDKQVQNQKFSAKLLPFAATWRSLARNDKGKILIWPELNYFYGHLSVYGLAKKSGFFQAIYTYSLVNEKEWLLALSKDSRRTKDSIANRFVDRYFAAWVRLDHSLRIRLPLSFPVLAKLVGYTTYNPWLPGAIKSVPIFAPDTFTLNYLRDSGYESSHIFIGGMPKGTDLLELRTSYLAAKGTQKSKRPSVVVALPPDQTSDPTGLAYHSLLNKTIFATVTEMQNLADFAFVFHPRLSETSRSALIQRGIVVLNQDLAKAVAECDVYVACSSATLRIAEALGVQAIDYDIYKFGYQDFEAARVVRAADDASNFRSAILALLDNSVEYEMDQKIAGNPVKSIIQMALAKPGPKSSKANGVI